MLCDEYQQDRENAQDRAVKYAISGNVMKMPPPTSPKIISGHIPQLDGLRGLAVLFVQWFHYSPVGRHVFGESLGAIGVDLFFVLSGYLITGILLDAESVAKSSGEKWFVLRQFYIRRALRLAPLFYATILCAVVIDTPPFRTAWPWHVTYLSNFYQWFHGRGGYGSNLWSLAVEEQFYLLWPIILVFLPMRYIPRAMVLLVLLAPLFRLAVVKHFPGYDPYLMLPSAWDCLGAGALMATAPRTRSGIPTVLWARLLLGSGLLVLVAAQLPGWWILRQTGWALCFAWLVYLSGHGLKGRVGRLLKSRPLVFIGKISYGVYVLQGFALYYWYWLLYSSPLPISRVCDKFGIPISLFTGELTDMSMSILITLIAAILSHRFIETPIHSLRHHFPFRKSMPSNKVTDLPQVS